MSTSDPTRWRRVEALFERALDLSPSDRDALLRAEAADDPALADEVRALLAADAEAGAYFEDVARSLSVADPLSEGDLVGPYRITGRLGEGGMGVVYRAERADGSFEREVALKVLRGAGGGDVRRFLAERQILARLDHPAIGRLYDGGLDDRGQPFLAMELVEGEPITDYCDRRRLGVEDRLGLFRRVCEAVQFAHGRLVVHRDLKPSNVMVSEDDGGAPQVKLLDFGIAKLLDADVELTQTGAAPHTPAYAAPEQVRGEEVTTATDVYALGVLLYELLTGVRPYQLESRRREAVEQAILHAEPTQPSTAVLTQPGADPTTVAAARASEPTRLRRRLRGDLDRIVLKALRKEPERRYDGAAALGRDVARHLDGLPIEARPESVGYRIGKFVRRHRGGVALAALAVLGLMGGLGAALWQASVASDQRDRAEAEARKAEEVTAFVTSLFGEADPNEARGETPTVLEALGLGAERARTELAGEPDVQAAVLATIGRVYRELGDLDQADSLLTEAGAIGGLGDVARADVLEDLGILRQAQGEYAATDSLYQEVLRLRLGALGPEHDDVASTYDNLGVLRRYQGEYAEAETFLRRALALRDASGRTDTREYALNLGNLGVVLTRQQKLPEAERAQRAALALQRAVDGDTSLAVASTSNNLGTVLHEQGRYEEAETQYLRAIGIWRHILGDDHPNVAIGLSNVGTMYVMADRPEEARPFYQESLDLFRATHGEDHPDVAFTVVSIASLERIAGNLDLAVRLGEEGLASYRRTLEPDHPYIGTAEHELGRTLMLREDPSAADHYRRALAVYADALTPDHSRVYSAQIELGEILLEQGDQAEGERLLRAALPHAEAAEDSARVAEARTALASI